MTEQNGFQAQYVRTGDFVSESVMDTAHKLMAVSGFNMNREWINWQDLASRTDFRFNINNTNPGVTVGGGNADYTASLNQLSDMVDNLQYYGIDSMLVLQGTPDWAHPGKINNIADGPHGGLSNPGNPNGLGDPYPGPQPFDTNHPHWEFPPNDWQDYRDMASALVTKLKGKVKAYEIINEADTNGQGNIVGGYKTIGQYMKHFYQTAKAIDPDAQVLAPASDKMLPALAADGAMDYADGASYHGYAGSLSGMRAMLESAGTMKHIWMTEHSSRHPELVGKVRSQGRWTVFSAFENSSTFDDHHLIELRDASGSRVVGNQPKGLGDRVVFSDEMYDYGTMSGKLESGNYDGAKVANRIKAEVVAPAEMAHGVTQTVTLKATNTSATTFTNVHLWPIGFVDNLGYDLTAIRAEDRLIPSFAPGQTVTLTLDVTPTTTLYKAGGTYAIGLGITNDQGKHSLAMTNVIVNDEVIVDNGGAGYAETGASWADSAIGGAYGGTSRWNHSQSAAQYATFTPTIALAGDYDIYVWKFAGDPSSTAQARYVVHDSAGTNTSVTVDQTTPSNHWQKIATAALAAGTGGYVKVDAGTGDGKTVRADAVKFVRKTPAAVEYVFADNFEDGVADGWTADAGYSVITDGSKRYQVDNPNGTNNKSVAGDAAWTNYAVQATVKPTTFYAADKAFGVYARYADANNKYAFYYSGYSGAWILSKTAGGTNTILATGSAYTIAAGTEYNVKLVVDGTSLKGYVNGVLQAQATDSALTAGKIGVYGFKIKASFDNVAERRPFIDDFEDGVADGWNADASFSVITDGSKRYQVDDSSGTNRKAVTGGADWTDYTVQVVAKPAVFYTGDKAFGVYARYTDMNNKYTFYYSGFTGAWILSKTVGGATTVLAAGAASAITAGTEYTLKLEAGGTSLKGYVNGVLQAQATDGSLAAGMIGVYGYRIKAAFDNVEVR
ncbi:golvesin C-terminal-like domain-containing protein [Paenibacillus cymbidii]|uniref:golvesin C-terminal-like domain-containing protein n=1 Tax=Paenibacillus cymbidii TaxID=1639034 RepID=UPI001080A4DF|nr:hypothetical protein [Paenibacillus cymbidii]